MYVLFRNRAMNATMAAGFLSKSVYITCWCDENAFMLINI